MTLPSPKEVAEAVNKFTDAEPEIPFNLHSALHLILDASQAFASSVEVCGKPVVLYRRKRICGIDKRSHEIVGHEFHPFVRAYLIVEGTDE